MSKRGTTMLDEKSNDVSSLPENTLTVKLKLSRANSIGRELTQRKSPSKATGMSSRPKKRKSGDSMLL